MQCICSAKNPSRFRINEISWGFCSAPFVFAVWPRWCLMIRPSWRHSWWSRRFRKTRGGAFDLWVNQTRLNSTKFHTDKIFLEDWLGVSRRWICALVFFSLVVSFLLFVGRSLLLECFWQTAMFWSVVFFCNLPIRKCRLSLFCRCLS